MELHPLVAIEWREDHALSRRSLIWIRQHGDLGDDHPIRTAIEQLRAVAVSCDRPSRGRYVGKHPDHPGCRCPGCTAENARWIAAYRLRGSTPPLSLAGAKVLRTPCWCEAKRKLIPAADVAAGRTWSCGRPDCQPTASGRVVRDATGTVSAISDPTPDPSPRQPEPERDDVHDDDEAVGFLDGSRQHQAPGSSPL